MTAFVRWRVAAMIGASVWFAALSAQAIRVTSPVVLPIDAGRCVRSPDITFEGDSYFVAYAVTPCSGPGLYEFKLLRFDRSFASTGNVVLFSASITDSVPPPPLVSVSSARGTVVTVAALSNAGATPLRAFAVRSTGPLLIASSQQQTSDGTVRGLSVDCHAIDPTSPCALATIEDFGLVRRAFVRVVLEMARNRGPATLIMGQSVTSIAAVAGDASERGAALTTDFLGSSAFFGPATTGAFVDLEPRAPLIPVGHGVAALRTRSGVAAIWSRFAELVVLNQRTWASPAPSSAPLDRANAAFLINDATQIGRTFAVVGRSSASNDALDGAPFSVVSVGPNPTSPLVAQTLPLAMTSAARIASPTLCSELGSAAAVFSTSAGAPPVSGLALVRYRCSDDAECLDSEGTAGACTMGTCVFRAGPCVADSGVASGTDASALDANPIIPPVDAEPADASADGAASDALGLDSAGSDGANSQGIPRRVEYRGGACQCRAGAVRGRVSSLPLVVVGLALAAAIRRRRSRRKAQCVSLPLRPNAACAAASRAVGTLNGEQLT